MHSLTYRAVCLRVIQLCVLASFATVCVAVPVSKPPSGLTIGGTISGLATIDTKVFMGGSLQWNEPSIFDFAALTG